MIVLWTAVLIFIGVLVFLVTAYMFRSIIFLGRRRFQTVLTIGHRMEQVVLMVVIINA